MAPGSSADGKSIQMLSLPPRCLLAAILRKGDLILPRGDTILQAADEVLAIVHSEDLAELAGILGPVRQIIK